MFAARAGFRVWRKKTASKLSREVALSLAVLMIGMAVVGVNEIMNSVINGPEIKLTTGYLVQGFIGRALRSFVTWYAAWKLTQSTVPILPKPVVPAPILSP